MVTKDFLTGGGLYPAATDGRNRAETETWDARHFGDNAGMQGPLATVTAYPARDLARVARRELDFAGIDSVLDEPAEARVRVRVENVDALRAGDVLTRQCDGLAEIDEADEEETVLGCPACEAPQTATPSRRARNFLLFAAFAIALSVGIQMPQAAFFAVPAAAVYQLVRGRWQCSGCGETWD